MECKNCGTSFAGKFCPQCGQKANTKRVSFLNLLHEIPESIFQVERGFLFTIKGLFIRPAGFLSDYFAGKRIQYYKPLGYVIILSTLTSLISYLVNLYVRGRHGYVTASVKLEGADLLLHKSAIFFAEYNSVFYFLMIPIISLCSFIFFYKKYNYWEHFIANTYLTAQFNFLIILAQIWRVFNDGNVWYTPFLAIFFAYLSIVYEKLFKVQTNKIWNRIKKILLFILIVFVYSTGLSLAGMMTPWWGTK